MRMYKMPLSVELRFNRTSIWINWRTGAKRFPSRPRSTHTHRLSLSTSVDLIRTDIRWFPLILQPSKSFRETESRGSCLSTLFPLIIENHSLRPHPYTGGVPDRALFLRSSVDDIVIDFPHHDSGIPRVCILVYLSDFQIRSYQRQKC